MSGLDPTFQAALDADLKPNVFHAVEITLAGGTLRLLDGAFATTISGEAYSGQDDTYGVLGGLQMTEDGLGSEAPSATITILPPSNTAAAALAQASAQGDPVRILFGGIDRAAGTLIGTPDVVFVGTIDVPKWVTGKSRMVSLDCVTDIDRLFENDEGLGLTDASHQEIWPGETGLQFVTGVQRQIPWGADTPQGQVITKMASKGGISGAIAQVLRNLGF